MIVIYDYFHNGARRAVPHGARRLSSFPSVCPLCFSPKVRKICSAQCLFFRISAAFSVKTTEILSCSMPISSVFMFLILPKLRKFCPAQCLFLPYLCLMFCQSYGCFAPTTLLHGSCCTALRLIQAK